MHKYHKSCSSPIWPFYGLLQLYDLKCQKTHISTISSAQVSQIVFLAYLTVLRLYYNMYDLKCQKTHISAISVHKYHKSCFLAYLTILRLFTTVWPEMSENSYLRHFSASSITNLVFSLFDCFTTYYNCMTWNVRKLISPPLQCTRITNRVLSLLDRFKT